MDSLTGLWFVAYFYASETKEIQNISASVLSSRTDSSNGNPILIRATYSGLFHPVPCSHFSCGREES